MSICFSHQCRSERLWKDKLNSMRLTPFVAWKTNILCLYLAFDQSATWLNQVIYNYNVPTLRFSLLDTYYPLISLPNFCTNYLYMHCEGGYGAIWVNNLYMQNRWKHPANYVCLHQQLLHKRCYMNYIQYRWKMLQLLMKSFPSTIIRKSNWYLKKDKIKYYWMRYMWK